MYIYIHPGFILRTASGNYGFNSVFEDYDSMLYTMSDNPNPQDNHKLNYFRFLINLKLSTQLNMRILRVRILLLWPLQKLQKIKGYSDYRTLIQCFAVFKEINSRWNYVSDPKDGDYIATASESLSYFSGDCDDHSILMAASVRAIGGTPRLIHTKGHIYPEI
jgi:hypothetical protein